MEQNNSISIPVIPGMRGDIEPHTAPPGTILLANNVRFPSPGVVQSRRGKAQISATVAAADVQYSDVLNTSQGPDFLHGIPGGYVYGAAGFGYRYDAGQGLAHIAGSYSTAQPRGRFDVQAREELTPADNKLFPWPLSCAVKSGLVATCYSLGDGQPAVSGGFMGAMRDNADPVATAGALVRVFTESGAVITSAYDLSMVSAAVVANHAPGTTNPIAIVYQDTGGTDLRVALISSAGAVGASVSIGTLSTGTSFWAACDWPGIGWAVVYQSAAGVLTFKKMAGSAASATQTQAITAGAEAPVSIYANTTHLFVGWAIRGGGSFDAQYRPFDTTLTATAALQTVQALGSANPYLGPPLFGPCVAANTVMALVGHAATAQPVATTTFTTVYRLTTAGVVSAGAVQATILPLSAPFNNGMWWARLATSGASSVQSQRAILLDHQNDRTSASDATTWLSFPKIALVCDAFAGFEGDTLIRANIYRMHLHPPAQLSSGEWLMGVPRIVRCEEIDLVDAYLPLAEFLKFATGCEQQVKTCGDDVLVSGSLCSVAYSLGSLTYHNGAQQFNQQYGLDIGFPCAPGIRDISSSNSTGSLDNNGVYQYMAVSEYIDARGRRWRSQPSAVGSITLGAADDTVLLALDAFHPIMRAFSTLPANSRHNVHLYRTENAGDQFQRNTNPIGAPVPYTDGTANWLDEQADGVTNEHEFIYTSGGAVQNDMPPSCRFIAVTEDRVWLAGLWEEGIAQSSKLLVPGQPIEFSDLDSFKVSIAGVITGLAAQDGTLIIFEKNAIHIVQGLGPNDQGQGAWDTPRCITRSTGCIDWRSIVETSVGIFYQSERGIMLLPRGAGEPVFIGAPVEAFLSTVDSTITGSAVCHTSDGLTVQFCIAAGVLIFDLETSAWSYDSAPAVPSGTIHTKVCDTDAGPTYARKLLTSGFGFDQEQEGLTADAGAPIASAVEWTPVHPTQKLAGWWTFTGAISGFGKLDNAPFPAASVSVRCDVDAITNQATLASMASMGTTDYRRLTVPSRQGCAATLAFNTAAAPWRFFGWTLELEDLRGTRNIPQVETY